MQRTGSPPPTDWVPQRRHSKWRLGFFRAVERAAVLCGGRAFYRKRYLAKDRVVVREEVLRVPDLPPALDGLRVVQWGDLHAGPFLRSTDLDGVVERTRELRPDLFVLTGDYLTHTVDEGLELAPALGRIDAPLGAFAVFGNHDYRGRQEQRLVDRYAEEGVRVLRDESVRLERDGAVLALVGLEDLEEARSVDIERARGRRGRGEGRG